MQHFEARVKFYVHAFSAIQDWFGYRGIALIEGDLKQWCYDGHFLYWQCNPSAPIELHPDDDLEDVGICVLASICFEPYDYMPYDKSPFSNKIKHATIGGNTMELEKHQASPELLEHFKRLLALKERLRKCIDLNDRDEELRAIYNELDSLIKQDNTL